MGMVRCSLHTLGTVGQEANISEPAAGHKRTEEKPQQLYCACQSCRSPRPRSPSCFLAPSYVLAHASPRPTGRRGAIDGLVNLVYRDRASVATNHYTVVKCGEQPICTSWLSSASSALCNVARYLNEVNVLPV
jgi:hypothetical protein